MSKTLDEKRAYKREWQRRFRAQNPEYYRSRYAKNRTKSIRSSQNWYVKNLTGDFDKKLKCLLYKAKYRARDSGLEFSVTAEDFKKVTHCPLLGCELSFNNSRQNRANSPSIDRIDSTKGYVPGNVWIISARANQIKNDATVHELELILQNLKKKIKAQK